MNDQHFACIPKSPTGCIYLLGAGGLEFDQVTSLLTLSFLQFTKISGPQTIVQHQRYFHRLFEQPSGVITKGKQFSKPNRPGLNETEMNICPSA